MMQKTYVLKGGEIKREQHTVDVADKILGRVATEIASLLMGKHKVAFSRNVDMGDMVTVINASKVLVTGNKGVQKKYYRHSNYPGGFRITTFNEMMASHPERIIEYAVDGMLPQNHLKDKMMTRLRIFAGEEIKPVAKPAKPAKPARKAKETKAPAQAKKSPKAAAKVEAKAEAPAEPKAETTK
jgi:large subunit ribosomal protein L13